jgi:hypothetical protein
MRQEPHPDEVADWQSLKSITRGGTQSADDQAMDAYWRALEEGKTVDEAGEVFIKEYQKGVYGK